MHRYGLRDYGAMLADRVRMDAYTEALGRAITGDSVVLDLGTGEVTRLGLTGTMVKALLLNILAMVDSYEIATGEKA